MKNKIIKFIAYILVQYILIYGYYFVVKKINWHWQNIKNEEDIIFTAWIFLSLPLIEIIILIFPMLMALKKEGVTRYLILIFCFVVEFFICWFMTNEKVETWMIVKIVLSVVLFFLFFRKQLHLFYK